MNLDELQKKCDALFDAKHDKALDEIERLQSQLAARDALIERLVEAGEKACSDYNWFGYTEDGLIKPKSLPLEFDQDEFEEIVEEWEASKDGGGE